MSEYLIQGEVMTSMAQQARRILNTQDGLTALQIAELLGRIADTSLDGEFSVKVIDYDGTILTERNVFADSVFVMPDPPQHNNLVFDKWMLFGVDIEEYNYVLVKRNPVIIAPIYYTASGATEIDVAITSDNQDFVLNIGEMTSVDWGDGTVDSGEQTQYSHTYSYPGSYTIKAYKQDGTAEMSSAITSDSSDKQAITNIRIGKNISAIGRNTFKSCSNLTSVTIPDSVTSIGQDAFSGCEHLVAIVIPSCTAIESRLFLNCYSLTTAICPIFSHSLFHGCSSLQLVTIPSSVTQITQTHFYLCSKLTSIVYEGTTTQWTDGTISFGTNWNYYLPSTFTVYCADGTISKTGVITPY